MNERRRTAPPDEPDPTPRGPRRPIQPGELRPIMPERPTGSWLLRALLLGLLATGGYGAYYGYCRYKVNDLKYQFAQECHDLHMAVMRRTTQIKPEDIKAVAVEIAEKSGVHAVAGSITVMLEPMNDSNANKLPAVAEKAMNILASLPKLDQDAYVGGFKGRFYAEHGAASETFEAERYTWWPGNVIAGYKKPGSGKPGIEDGPDMGDLH